MDGYKMQAEAYEEVLQKKKDLDPLVVADLQSKIKAFKALEGTEEKDRANIFNTGAFNDITKAYFKKAMEGAELDQDTITAVLDEYKYLLDTVSASEIMQ